MNKKYLLILVLLIGSVLNAQGIGVKINDSVEEDFLSLESALGETDLSVVETLEVVSGDFTFEDWKFLKLNRSLLTSMTRFLITTDVNSVADIIGSNSAYFNGVLEEVSVAKLERIGNRVFAYCSSLQKVSLPQATSIGLAAFYGCGSLTEFELPSTPPMVYDVEGFINPTSTSFVEFVDSNGVVLEGDDSVAAINAYKAVADGDVTDALWYGCVICYAPSDPVIGELVSYVYGDTASPLPDVDTDGNTLRWYTSEIGGVPETGEVLPNTSLVGVSSYWASHFSNCGESSRVKMDVIVSKRVLTPFLIGNLVKVYDGGVTVEDGSNLNLELSGGLADELVNIDFGDFVYVDANVGEEKLVLLQDLEISEPQNLNYVLSNDVAEGYVGTITKKEIVVTPSAGLSKEEGADDPELTYTYSSELFGDDSFTGSLSREEGEGEGSYAILLGSLDLGSNYEIVLAPGGVFEIVSTTSIDRVLFEEDVVMYPNPSQGVVNVRAGNSILKSVTLYDLQGQEVLKIHDSVFNVQGLSDRVYFVKIESESGGVVFKKLIKN